MQIKNQVRFEIIPDTYKLLTLCHPNIFIHIILLQMPHRFFNYYTIIFML
jgi:hypothetical protein